MAAILADDILIVFPWMKTIELKKITETCSLWSNWQYGSIGSDNGLAPNKRQAIILTKVGMLYWRI